MSKIIPRPRPSASEAPEGEQPTAASTTDVAASAPSESAATSDPAPASTPVEPPVEWKSLGLSSEALLLIEKAGFQYPTPVQAKTIPLALEGKDTIASAQTGTGKTASFVLPMTERFAGREGTYGLILAPTREIAQQIQESLELFGAPRGLRSVVLIGGIDMKIDAAALQTYPQIIIATPGRLCDHIERGNIWLDFIQMVVLDEADRMLDMGFAARLSRIMEEVPRERQTMIFSATFAPPVENLARRTMNNPERVAIGKPSVTASTVEQRFLRIDEEAKLTELMYLFQEEPGTIIVFTRSKDRATRLWRSLHSRMVYDATFIHSDRLQADREQALADFKAGKFRILIATDVAGRGIHVDGVAHVVNYDLPMEPEDYVHRIGRTGRQGATGKSTTFVTPQDGRRLRDIERILGKRVFGRDERPRGEGRGGQRHGGRGGRDRAESSGQSVQSVDVAHRSDAGSSSSENSGAGGAGGDDQRRSSRRKRRRR